MDSKSVVCDLRRKFSLNGWILLIYYGIMNVSVLIAIILDALVLWFRYLLNPEFTQSGLIQSILSRSPENGWGYLLACVIGGIILIMWRKTDFCFHQLWTREKRMRVKPFLVLFCVFMSGQAIQIIQLPVVEWLLSQFGVSTSTMPVSATGGSTSFSMFLYVAFFAPVFEEILFRGLILRNSLPYGKKFAIVTSSFLFGIFHGNIIQTPYAFIVGLVLGYTAVEYGLIWSIVLHIFNNFVLGELSAQIARVIPPMYVNLALYVLIFGCAIATLVLAAIKWRRIADYLRNRRVHPLCLKGFFSAKGVIVFTAIMLGNMLSLLRL